MTGIELALGHDLAQAAGWTLLHFIWQGCLIALLPISVRAFSTCQSAQLRYGTACLALALMAVSPLVTFNLLRTSDVQSGVTSFNSEDPPISLSLSRSPAATRDSFALPWLQNANAAISPWLPWLTAAWLSGVLLLSFRLAGGMVYTQRLRRKCDVPARPEWQKRLVRLCRQLQIRQTVLLLESASIHVPTVVGLLRPAILLPSSTLTGLTVQQLEAILVHELAHIRRQDYLVNLLQTVVETLLFYHPSVWWVSQQVRLERENCCDDLAVEVQGDPLAYARALAKLETLRADSPQLALAASGGSLLARIERLIGPSQTSKTQPASWLSGLMVAVCLLGLAVGLQGDVFSEHPLIGLPDTAESSRSSQTRLTDVVATPPLETPPSLSLTQTDRINHTLAEGKSEPGRSVIPVFQSPILHNNVPLEHSSSSSYAYLQNAAQGGSKKTSDVSGTGQQANVPTKGDYVAELRRLGFANLTVDELIELKSHGVSIEFIEGLKNEGVTDLSIENLLKLRSHGVQPDLIRSLKASGYSNLEVGQLLKLRMHGVTPQFVSEMGAAGFPNLPPEALIKARQHGVSPVFIKELQSLGYSQLSLDDLIRARMHGVDSAFIKDLQSVGHKGLSLNDLVKARQHGVDAAFAKTFEPLGYGTLSIEQLVRLRNHGVSGEFVQGIRQEGYDAITIDELIRLRNHGVNVDFIRRMKSQGFQKLTLDQLIKLRMAGF